MALTKTGNGTLVLNSTSNANNSLIIGGFNGGGGTVMTQMTSGTPFGTGAVTLTDGTLQLQGTVGTAPGGVTASGSHSNPGPAMSHCQQRCGHRAGHDGHRHQHPSWVRW